MACSADEARARAHDLLRKVGLDPALFADRYPHELSGGQRQRVNIARALALAPRLVLLDEAVSALDKSVEAQVLNLLLDLKDDLGLTYVFISHDLNVVRFISDRVMVMYLGEVVEPAPVEALWADARHPYTRALLAAMPSLDPDHRTKEAPIAGDPPNPIDPPSGCRFHTRCPFAEAVCSARKPALTATGNDRHTAACHMVDPELGPQPGRPFICRGGTPCLMRSPRNASPPSRQRRECRSRLDRLRASRVRQRPRSRASPPRRSISRSRPSRRASSRCSAGRSAGERARPSSRSQEVAAAIRRRKLSSVELTRALARTDRALAARAQRVRARRGRRSAGGCQGGRSRARASRAEGTAARRAARPQGHVLLGGQACRLRLEGARGLDRAGHVHCDRAARGGRLVPARRAAHGRVRLRPDRAQRPSRARAAIHGTRAASPAARRRGSGGGGRGAARAMRRSAPTPAARSACRRISAASPASSRPTAASAAPTRCRSRSRSTPSVRWRRPPRIARLIAVDHRRAGPARPDHRRRAGVGREGGQASPKGLKIGVPTDFYVDDLEPDVGGGAR